ncbi:ROK family protein [Actinotalea ferrariae]|uniref:ROK family protein n=1 Tax=Actinotalea ferrariae TaxID=1386098 RepID=UPI001C8B879C|nr:ROK family protein [Actinotalea ferrariae]MBX9243585.1 ROK family protein [Actinotalea ferrariae]
MTAAADQPGRGWSVGLDIGGTKISAVLVDADAMPRSALRVPTRRGVEGVVDSAAEATERLCAAAGLTPADLDVVGAGVPGMVDSTTGAVSHAVNLGIDGVPVALGDLLGNRMGRRPVWVENDLNVAALGAAQVLRLTGDLAFLALGTGVAAGLILDGRLRRGHLGIAGEVGHIPYVADGARCACGQHGCLELYASGSALDAAWPSRWGRPAPAELFEAAEAGDAAAVRVRDEYADAVAAGVRTLVLTCDVAHVVLGGGVAEVGAPLQAAVVAALRRQAVGSAFLTSLRIADRLLLAPRGSQLAPLGAALSARMAHTDPSTVKVAS